MESATPLIPPAAGPSSNNHMQRETGLAANARSTEYISNGCHAAAFHESIVGAKEPRPKKVVVGRITTGEEIIPSFPFSSAILIGDQSSDGQS